jgi:hypothetical protein
LTNCGIGKRCGARRPRRGLPYPKTLNHPFVNSLESAAERIIKTHPDPLTCSSESNERVVKNGIRTD